MTGKSRGAFRGIADTLRSEIRETQVAGANTALGSETNLAERFGVARNTLRRALSELEAEGLIHSRPAKGWFVGPATGAVHADPVTIAETLAARLASGKPVGGEKFGTAPAIAEEFGVTVHAARQALGVLGARGLIESQHGKGWFVR